ncbi:hypothetical protein QOZ80_1BG0060210 [Eleusine coracana subsp. coracana]|nr:hypothetical protein QOZ80_1BG0060210 [Eleusine coracana subsp. coracana]
MGPVGSGIGTFLVLVAACLSSAPPCTLASSRKFDSSVPQSKPVISKGNTFSTNFDPSKSKRLSWHPRVFLYEGFLSDLECNHLISMGRDKKKSSLVIGDGVRNSSQDSTDSSVQVYLTDSKDTVVSKIEDRISLWSFLPKEYGEDMQILKYNANKSDYNKHGPQSSSSHDLLITILVYLSYVKLGGQTVFPRSELKGTQGEEGIPSECVGYAVKPVKGNAILLFNLKPDGVKDKDSQYEVCSILEGEEWIAIKHIHVRKIDTPKPSLVSDDECTDEDNRCIGWAAGGECDRNPVFMIGSPDYYGTCRKSCHVC